MIDIPLTEMIITAESLCIICLIAIIILLKGELIDHERNSDKRDADGS